MLPWNSNMLTMLFTKDYYEGMEVMGVEISNLFSGAREK